MVTEVAEETMRSGKKKKKKKAKKSSSKKNKQFDGGADFELNGEYGEYQKPESEVVDIFNDKGNKRSLFSTINKQDVGMESPNIHRIKEVDY